MLRWIAHIVTAAGYWGVAALMALENIVLPLPSELIMPLAGYDVDRRGLTLPGVIIAGTAGSVVGSFVVYLLARALGKERVTQWVKRHGKWLLLRPSSIDKAHDRFASRGGFMAVLVARLLPAVRGLIALPAGFAHMSLAAYLAANLAGTLVWCALLAVAGKLLGPGFMKIDRVLGPAGWIILAVLAAGGFAWGVRRHRKARAFGSTK